MGRLHCQLLSLSVSTALHCTEAGSASRCLACASSYILQKTRENTESAAVAPKGPKQCKHWLRVRREQHVWVCSGQRWFWCSMFSCGMSPHDSIATGAPAALPVAVSSTRGIASEGLKHVSVVNMVTVVEAWVPLGGGPEDSLRADIALR